MLHIQLSDPNLSGTVNFEIESRQSLNAILSNAGAWQSSPDGGGDLLLSTPSAWVFLTAPGPDAYPDFVVTVGPRGGITWTRA